MGEVFLNFICANYWKIQILASLCKCHFEVLISFFHTCLGIPQSCSRGVIWAYSALLLGQSVFQSSDDQQQGTIGHTLIAQKFRSQICCFSLVLILLKHNPSEEYFKEYLFKIAGFLWLLGSKSTSLCYTRKSKCQEHGCSSTYFSTVINLMELHFACSAFPLHCVYCLLEC